MKDTIKLIGIIALVTVIGFTIAACGGGGNPKSLAKQTYDLTQEALSVGTDVRKAASLAQKAATLDQKVSKLSEKDMEIYMEELTRLTLGSAASTPSRTPSSSTPSVSTPSSSTPSRTPSTDASGTIAEQEPNDYGEDAQLIPVGASVSGDFSHDDDEDYYKFVITRPGRFTAYTESDIDIYALDT